MDGNTTGDGGASPPDPERWTQVTTELEGIAEAYRSSGWDAVTAVPESVATRRPEADPEGRGGFDLLLRDDAFESLAEFVAGRSFDAYEVFRGDGEGATYLVVAVEADESARAVLYPAYFTDESVVDLHETADAGPLYTHLRSPESDERVTFTHEAPDPFFPEWGEGAE
jgi:hypothetical protein